MTPYRVPDFLDAEAGADISITIYRDIIEVTIIANVEPTILVIRVRTASPPVIS